MAKTVTLTLRADDAEPILREAAKDAAKFGAWCDYITKRTVNSPARNENSSNLVDIKRAWQTKFLTAKRVVESFGVEYEPTSEQETLGVYIPIKVLKSHAVNLGGLARLRHIDESEPDPANARPEYQPMIHSEACKQAAERVVRKWRETL